MAQGLSEIEKVNVITRQGQWEVSVRSRQRQVVSSKWSQGTTRSMWGQKGHCKDTARSVWGQCGTRSMRGQRGHCGVKRGRVKSSKWGKGNTRSMWGQKGHGEVSVRSRRGEVTQGVSAASLVRRVRRGEGCVWGQVVHEARQLLGHPPAATQERLQLVHTRVLVLVNPTGGRGDSNLVKIPQKQQSLNMLFLILF